jgi:hypothetical protein
MWENEDMNRLHHRISTVIVFTMRRMVISQRQAVSKRRYGIAVLHCVKFKKNADLVSSSVEV